MDLKSLMDMVNLTEKSVVKVKPISLDVWIGETIKDKTMIPLLKDKVSVDLVMLYQLYQQWNLESELKLVTNNNHFYLPVEL